MEMKFNDFEKTRRLHLCHLYIDQAKKSSLAKTGLYISNFYPIFYPTQSGAIDFFAKK